jgi:hypothetical protein
MKRLISILLLLSNFCFGQSAVTVAELTVKIKVNSEEIMYYGFDQGDQIIFSCEEINGKEVKEINIIEYPSTIKFSNFKSSKVENKKIDVVSKGVYKFVLKNSNLIKGRVCRVKIQRIPMNEESQNFNTSVKWITKQDTTWNSYTKKIVVGYDTLLVNKTRKRLIFEEKYEEQVLDKSQRNHSQTNSNGNKTSLFFTLPMNQANNYETRRVVAWAYWVGVGEESNVAWQKNGRLITGTVNGIASLTLSPLGAIALGTATNLVMPTMGEDVIYTLVDQANKDLYYSNLQYRRYDFGKGVAGYKRFTNLSMMQGTYWILLENDNIMTGIDVNVKVLAIIEHKKYIDEPYTEVNMKPRYETKIITDPIIKTEEVPINFD